MKALQADATDVVKEWKSHGISHAEQPELASDFARTFPGGAWYFTRLVSILTAEGAMRSFDVPTLAFHSTSVENGAKIVRNGGLKKGVSNSGGANGYVFVEKNDRRHHGFRYATVTLCKDNPALATCAVFQLCVDRGDTVHGVKRVVKGQWVQEEHRVFITGVYTHIFPIAHLYAKGMSGWASIHESVYTNLQHLQVGKSGNAWLARPTDADMD